MDKTTHEVRLANWKPIIEQCLGRPEGQTVKEWLSQNNINEKQYYYWLRRIRQESYKSAQLVQQPPAMGSHSEIAFAEIRMNESPFEQIPKPAVVIRTANALIHISASAPAAMTAGIMKAVSHAL